MHKAKFNCCQCRISEAYFLMDTRRIYFLQTNNLWMLPRVSDAQEQTPSQLLLDRLLCVSPDVCQEKHQPPMTLKGMKGFRKWNEGRMDGNASFSTFLHILSLRCYLRSEKKVQVLVLAPDYMLHFSHDGVWSSGIVRPSIPLSLLFVCFSG